MGLQDPRRQDGHLHPLLAAFIDRLADEDGPQTRTYPVNVTIIEQLYDTLDTDHLSHGQCNRHVIHIIVLGFFFMLRPAEYLKPRGKPEPNSTRSTPFRLCDVHFAANGRQYVATDASLNDVNLSDVTHVTLTFTDQKNAVRGERIGHTTSGDPRLCPVVAAFHITRHLRNHSAPADTPLYVFWESDGTKRFLRSTNVLNGLRHTARAIQHLTGIDPSWISARSLRPGGATALLCAGVDSDNIKLLGRWKSDAMFRYLRAQAHTFASNFARGMLTAGRYTFAPPSDTTAVPLEQPLPIQAPQGLFQQAPAVSIADSDSESDDE
jgi:hypothetical protein